MKPFGIILLIAGIILGIYTLSMDTSVEVDYYNYSYELPKRVHNIGLINKQRNLLIVSGILFITGLIITLTSKTIKTNTEEIEILATQKMQQKIQAPHSQQNVSNIVDDLKKIKELLDNGAIIQEEFEKMKETIMNTLDKSSTIVIKQEEQKSNDIISNKGSEKKWITYHVEQGKLEIEIYIINKFPWTGDTVKLNGEPAPDGKYKTGLFSVIKVKDSKVYK